MGNVVNLITVLLLALILLLEVIPFFKPKREQSFPPKPQKLETPYTLSFEGTIDLVEKLLREGYRLSYSDGKVFLVLENRTEVQKVLNLYKEYVNKTETRKWVLKTLLPLIKEDIEETKVRLKELRKEYLPLRKVLKERNLLPDLGIFKNLIRDLQRETFEKFLLYWERKREQIESGYRTFVEEPKVSIETLLEKASQLYGNSLKLKLFKLYLEIKLLESRLTADLFKYNEYGG